MARGKPRRTDDPSPLRSAAEAQAHPPAVSRSEGGAHAGVRPALVANGRRFIARYRAPAVSLQPIGSDEIEDYRVELEDVVALEVTIVPNISGGDAYASLAELRLAGNGE